MNCLAPIIRICNWHLLHVKKIVVSTISSYFIRRDFLNVVQSLSRVQLFATPSNAALQASLSFSTSQSLLKLMSIESVMLSVSSSIAPFSSSSPESFPQSFPVSWLFAPGGQSTGASISVFPMNIHYYCITSYIFNIWNIMFLCYFWGFPGDWLDFNHFHSVDFLNFHLIRDAVRFLTRP